MCGECNRKVSGMATKRKQKKGSFQKALTMGGVGAAAMFAGRIATQKVAFLNSNPLVSAGAKIAAGTFAAIQKNEIVQGAGYGLIAGGGLDLLDHYMPNGIGSTPRRNIQRNKQIQPRPSKQYYPKHYVKQPAGSRQAQPIIM